MGRFAHGESVNKTKTQAAHDLKYLDKLPSGRWRRLIRDSRLGRFAKTYDTLEVA